MIKRDEKRERERERGGGMNGWMDLRDGGALKKKM